ncbi:MAG: hypothetical protein H8E70_04875 [Candidatus Marinimicrobia bacterium]|nr:hypothetical protein [Candidatus Neomarinimicrobiota bacterium]
MKRALSVFSVLLIGLIASASTLTTRFYLTDLDFISNQPVPESETRFKSHISADYDENNNIIKKMNIDRRGNINQTDIFLYDSLGVLKSKDIFLSKNILDQQVLFGMETKAVEYIEYVYGVDTVKDWTDRFSILDFNNLAQLTNHAFFDVNAFQYGNAHFEYDSLGYLGKEEWIRQPSGKTMRWWDHYFDPVNQLARIMEYDSNGVLVQDFQLSPDGTESIFWFTNFDDSAFVNNTNLSFKNGSYLEWGKVKWYRVDYDGIYIDSVEYNLSRQFLDKGQFETNLGLDSALVDSSVYDIVFTGKGKSGYDATERKVRGVTFDISPPIMELFSKPFINEPKISFDQSEPIISAHVQWHAIHDTSSIISVEFDSSDLSKYGTGLFKPVNQVDLKDSVFYRIQIFGKDQAGNVSSPTIVDSIMFDIRPPEVELISPLHSEFRNFTTIDWIINEPFQSWKIDVKAIAGKPDYEAPHSFQSDSSLFTVDLMFKELTDEFQLNDGTVYRFELSAIDRAGNSSAVFKIDSVTYDITPPLLTTIYPSSGASINETTVSFSINEPLRAGEFRWEQTEGTMDSSAPHIIPMVEEELIKGDHIQVQLFNQTELTDGSVYTLVFAGLDRAGNVGKFLPNTEILFDAVPPSFTDVLPSTGTALNHQRISYTLSENVNTGSIKWTWVGGVKDNSAPYTSQFLESENDGGKHDSLLLVMSPPLVDGAIYNLEFNAHDRAGNVAETYFVENVLYDFTAPAMTVSFPTPMSFLNNKNFNYQLSETLEKGAFLLERKGGKEDPKSPYEIPLTIKEKSAGIHENQKLILMPEIVEGSIYKLSFSGYDRARNYTVPISLPGIQYDFTLPEIALLSLPDNTDINYLYISYDLSETLKEAVITWERTGGAADSKRSHNQTLLEDELLAGVHIKTHILNTPNLKDGAIYSVSMAGKDLAGNESNISVIKNIRYDITAPEIELTHPLDRTYVSSPAIMYSLNETLIQGKIIYSHSGGSPDPNAPYEIDMDLVLSQKGVHKNIFEANGPNLMEGGVYNISITGRDRAGNEAEVTSVSGIIYDAEPPVLTIQTSDSTLSVNHNRITFSKNEELESGTVTWTRTGGKSDAASPHKVSLSGSELDKGIKENYTLSNSPQLVDGAIYDISFHARDFAGNESETMIMSGVLYDISPPILKIVSPGNNHFTKGAELTFSHSEDLSAGLISWNGINEDNTILASSWDLNNQILQKGEYELNNYFDPKLEDGGNYTITFTGVDPAGNKAKPVSIQNYRIDRTPPEFRNVKPISGSVVNQDLVGYSLSEEIMSGFIIFDDGENVTKISIKEDLDRNKALPTWIDGKTYNIQLVGVDYAGNISDTIKIENIKYDISPPIITIYKPIYNSFVNETQIEFSISETLDAAELILESNSGNTIKLTLSDSYLLEGDHVFNDSLTLKENVPYTIYIQGKDFAGNTSQSQAIENVKYDVTKPELVIVSPIEGSIVNHDLISYTISENLLEGKMIWQDVSGLDTKGVYEIQLKSDELISGNHLDITLNEIPELVDGASYMIRLEGIDLAGNTNEATPINSYTFDASPPEFTQLSPATGSLVNEVNLGFTINENLANGQIVFTRTAGAVDIQSPHIVNLSGSRLLAGARGGKLPKEIIELINGATYKIEFMGEDLAGNLSAETKIDNITYDDEAPVVFLKAPTNNIHTNFLALDYLIGEDMTAGQIKIKVDNQKEIIIELAETQRLQGEYSQFIPTELAELKDGVTLDFELSGTDAAGNVSQPHRIENVKYDTTHPVIDIIKPVTDTAINVATMSINISENLAEGYLVVTQTGGVFDSRSPQKIPLLNQEIKLGEYDNTQFVNGPNLQNGSIYTFEFSGKDFAGNEVRTSKVTNVLFDNEPPVVSLSKPVDAEQIKTTEISYMLSDNLSKGIITFEHTGGTTDLVSPHVVELSGSQLRQGPQIDIDMKLMDVLADGARYTLSIQGWDRAGNESEIASVKDVLFDVLPPILAIHEPVSGSSFNEPIVSFEMNEKLAEGILTFKQTGGKADANSPHDVLILPPFNNQGRYDGVSLANDVSLQDGSNYSITFNARDPAGNVSNPVSVNSILYDITAPLIKTTAPLANSHLREMNVNYSINEKLVEGQINIVQTFGANDQNSPHVFQLSEDQLLPGDHQIDIRESVELVSGAEYILQISGQDRAGNASLSDEVGQLVYDIKPPVLEILSPITSSKVNHSKLAFSIGESLKSLSVAWIDENGNESNIELPERYLASDRFDQVVLKKPPSLISGSTYSIVLSGSDLAGNSAETRVEGIEYDDTPPVFTGSNPISGSFLNHTEVQFTINEPLQNGRVIWKGSGGASDLQSQRSIELAGEELKSGMLTAANLTNQILLNDGTVYDITIEGTDIAGNSNSAILAENITYDISPPVTQLLSPKNDSFLNNDNLDFNLNEDLLSGNLTWKRIFGTSDSQLHVIELSGDLLKAGNHSNSTLPDLPLVSGAQYQIELTGIDLAGNPTSIVSQRTFFYDTTPPQLTIDSPKEFTSINHLNFIFTVSEPIQSGEMIFTDENGVINKHHLTENELNILVMTEDPLTIPLNLNDGSTYSFILSGMDFAGNSAESPEISGIHYDISKPVFSIQKPTGRDVYVGSNISYTLSENIESGSAVWSREGGKSDGSSPHRIPLNSEEIKSGEYNDLQLENQSKLNVSTVYSLTMKGIDAAGNESLPTTVRGIEYIRSLDGNWFFQGAIMTVVWTFEGDPGSDGRTGKFSQGIQLGTKISNQEYGQYEIDFSSKPWTLRWTMDKSGMSRISIFEFQDENHLRVVTRDRKKPKDWTDGEVMMYEYR